MEDGHDEIVAEIIKRLEENDLYVKLEKCKWKIWEVEFLGVVIGPEGIKMKKEKVQGVLEWPTPKCIKNVQKFLGLANYYHQFIEGFAAIVRPLYDMVKKDQKWDWTKKQENVFQELKERFTKEPVLAAPDLDKKNENGSRCIGLCNRGYYLWSARMKDGDQWHFFPSH